jgi:hypothetical protein
MTAKSVGAAIILTMIAIGMVALFLGHRLVPGAASTQAAHSAQRDAAVVGFRTLVDRDMMAINAPFDKSSGCRSRQVCTAELIETRSGAEALVHDLAAILAPQVFVHAQTEITIAATAFIDELDVALVQLQQQPNSDYLAASGIPKSYNLRLAAAAVDCWPGKPLPPERTEFLPDNGGIPCV